MILKPGRVPAAVWALQNMDTSAVDLSELCTSELHAKNRCEWLRKHEPNRPPHRVIPVTVLLERADG